METLTQEKNSYPVLISTQRQPTWDFLSLSEKAIGEIKLGYHWFRWKFLFKEKHDYYVIIVRGTPEEHPYDCVIELCVTDKKMTIIEIKVSAFNEQIELLSRTIVLGNLLPVTSVNQAVEEMKDTADKRENENPYALIYSNYTSK
jgi:hypothetical protein